MNTADAIQKAAQLFAEWKEGDTFEQKYNDGTFGEIDFAIVPNCIKLGLEVRLKRRPKKVLRPVVEIFTEAAQRGLLTYQTVGDKGVLYASGFGVAALDEGRDYGFPEYFYTTDPTAQPADRIETVATAVADEFLSTFDSEESYLQLKTVVVDELRKAGF